jgi:hypothetical protein
MRNKNIFQSNRSNILLGDGNNDMKSSNQQMFQPYAVEKVDKLTDLREDLRSIYI